MFLCEGGALKVAYFEKGRLLTPPSGVICQHTLSCRLILIRLSAFS